MRTKRWESIAKVERCEARRSGALRLECAECFGIIQLNCGHPSGTHWRRKSGRLQWKLFRANVKVTRLPEQHDRLHLARDDRRLCSNSCGLFGPGTRKLDDVCRSRDAVELVSTGTLLPRHSIETETFCCHSGHPHSPRRRDQPGKCSR